jgi:Flp pilus assembly protein TadG
MSGRRGSALLEFAIAWPVALLLVMASVQLSVWASESYAVRQAALVGARAGSAADGSAAIAQEVALEALRPALVGVVAVPWCAVSRTPQPRLWVCVTWSTTAVEVRVGGSVPALAPLLPGGRGLPVAADVTLAREAFQ